MTSNKFLYEELDTLLRYGHLKKETPNFLKKNLNSKFKIRNYQEEAFFRFFHCFNNNFPNKETPLHLLFNMATGSGKTLIMAGLILYLYKKGFRNFLFFVNSTNIIEKTKNNFLNSPSSKYLFTENIYFRTRKVSLYSVDNFESINENDINICFTTIQKLHSDLNIVKENSLTYQDFKNKKIVLLADEAHHINTQTKQLELEKQNKPNWENTVEKVFKQNKNNLLLEFTATLNYSDQNIINKYRNKIIYKYDLKHFRKDGYSKDIHIVQSDFSQKERLLQAIILNQYKQEVATKNRIELKPVILFKAQRTIAQSKENKDLFHKIIESLSKEDILRIKEKSNLQLLKKAFQFFKENNISTSQLKKRLQSEFKRNCSLSVNEEAEKDKNQILLNTLEDKDNHIRAIFAVEKLNEGWDVLNLFDIVRCYETRDTKKSQTTIKEAQLIGRGARYFPFTIDEDEEYKFKRKFDKDLNSELRILEELHYHSINDNFYISEIKNALIKEGIIEEKQEIKKLELKDSFKKTDFYKKGLIYINKKVRRQYGEVKSLSDLGVSSKNYQHKIATGAGTISKIIPLEKKSNQQSPEGQSKDFSLKDIPFHIVQYALTESPFFTFKSLKKIFPCIQSIKQFITEKDYLGGLAITFQGSSPSSNRDFLKGVIGLLGRIEEELQQNITEYKGTEIFKGHSINKIFKDVELKISKGKSNGDEEFISGKDWYVFKSNYGTSEEKALIKTLDNKIDDLKCKYDEIYLIRNEKHFKIYSFKNGQGFEPDFVLFLKEKNGNMLTYQMFIEPKGKHLQEYDKWKEDFLDKIKQKFKNQVLEFITPNRSQKYKLTGVPFYNQVDENKFIKNLFSTLNNQ